MQQTPQKRIAAQVLPWGIAAALLLISAWRWSSLADLAKPSTKPAPDTAATRALALPVTLPVRAAFEDYRSAVERPLFHPSRQPFPDRKTLAALEATTKAKQAVPAPPPAPPPPLPPSPPQGIQLRGTVISGPLQSAVFERTGNQNRSSMTYIRVREGEQLDGWTLVKIDRQEVVLRLGDQTVTWPLTKSR